MDALWAFREARRSAIVRSTSWKIRELKALPITELGGKIRIASLHNADMAHLGRCINRRLLPFLKHLKVHRSALRGQEVYLTSHHADAVLYSADLTTATDLIRHRDADLVLHTLAVELRWETSLIDAARAFTQPMNLKGRETTRGVHMGLGTSWTVLSLLNAWAASSSPPSTHAICGDDLIGLWTRSQIDTYEMRLRSLGLKINAAKAFVAEGGVFCEHFVSLHRAPRGKTSTAHTSSQTQGDSTVSRGMPSIAQKPIQVVARSCSMVRLAEASGCRLISGLSDSPVEVRQSNASLLEGDRRLPKPVRSLIQATLAKTQVKGIPAGPAALGLSGGVNDGGWARRDYSPLVRQLITRGTAVRTMRGSNPIMGALSAAVIKESARPHEGGRIPVTELHSILHRNLADQGHPESTLKMSPANMANSFRARLARGSREMKSTTWQDAIKSCTHVTHTGRQKLLRIIPRKTLTSLPSPPLDRRTARRVVKLCLHHSTTQYVTIAGAERIVSDLGLRPTPLQDYSPGKWAWEENVP